MRSLVLSMNANSPWKITLTRRPGAGAGGAAVGSISTSALPGPTAVALTRGFGRVFAAIFALVSTTALALALAFTAFFCLEAFFFMTISFRVGLGSDKQREQRPVVRMFPSRTLAHSSGRGLQSRGGRPASTEIPVKLLHQKTGRQRIRVPQRSYNLPRAAEQ